ncbi:MAG: hypothetical protein PHO02_00840 [Candidatus Nanoarchaeia archaeon]|nr:hypothetical protein [Candidatus Nanoarchaeia archaeon]
MEKYVIPKGEALEVYQAQGAFDRCVDEFRAENLEMITAKQLAEARMLGGANHAVSRQWSWLAENFNYLPNGDILVASGAFNPLLQSPSAAKHATDCHRANPFREYFLNDVAVESLQGGAKHKGKVLLLKRKDVPSNISTDAFSKEAVTAFLFGDEADNYGRFLRENGIKNVPLYVVDKAHAKEQGKAFSRALWADYLYYNSALYGNLSNLYDILGRAFGVRRSEPEGRATAPQAPRGFRAGSKYS